jgi:predicted PurR-regulated permease PerM
VEYAERESAKDARRRELGVSISIRTILLAAVVVAAGAALASIKSVLLLLFVSIFSAAVLSPVATAMERRLGWSRRLSSIVLVTAIVVVIVAAALVMAQAVGGAMRGFSRELPQIADEARHTDLGGLVNKESGSLEMLADHASDITSGARKVSGGVVHVGISAFGAVAFVFSVIFLTLFGLIDEQRLRDWIGGLMYPDRRERTSA